ncbi:ribosome-binding factor A [Gordonia polyisoprenivorans NBRC 16320 = JCM 10675]|uniref:Ribosome-binding factor A n=1 Tax=Gordonia polyisoprenivorans TaxID=84595 RepID=A0A846WM76_9ACTN|nr:30S ribosome-binding factor RbfA [Gordonia polyisoprenivorans]NKY02698.1 30S ribosome-binding factor RbfA [Gordonia polyisoprenivorans]WCB39923.1 30S ribosome-binding factor RbfA [Gordonia polyisoprenivorans]GAB24679.1 ribosome-binding factor A [Gordonia polyisoprenivorans NBRC 16320 = JCM 10675]
MADPARAQRLAKRISSIVASAIAHDIKDPRLAHVTITDARVTGDLHDATLFYTVMGETLDTEPDYEAAAAGLAKATGVLRSKVGAGTGVRFTPTLTFVLDTVPDAARHMEELVARARASDELVARRAAEARPAGEADPYRAPGHDDDGDPDRDDEDGDQA